jgi:arabinose-5-phosphate isomerase
VDEDFLKHVLRFKLLEYTIDEVKGNSKKRALIALQSSQKALKNLSKSLPALLKAVELVQQRAGAIVVTGVGKSGFIGQKIAATLTSLGHRSVFLHPVDALHGDIGTVGQGDVVLAISFSGESNEVVRLVKYLRKEFDVQVVSLVKSAHTSLGTLSDVVIPLLVTDEGCPLGVAPMASTAATLVIGDMLAAALTEPESFKKKHFARLHPGGGLALTLRKVHEVMKTGRAVPLVPNTVSVVEALDEMSKKHLGLTGVVNPTGRLTGIVTDGDVRRFLTSSRFATDSPVSAMMTKKPKSIGASASLKEALALMEKHRITSLFVLDKGKPVGVVHIHDIIESNV